MGACYGPKVASRMLPRFISGGRLIFNLGHMEIQPKDEVLSASDTEDDADGNAVVIDRPIVLVGLMGAGKTSVGRRLAALLNVPFVDSDERIVDAAGMSIPDIFENYGEQEFRDVERRVIANLLDERPMVIAFGGGAFIDDRTRAITQQKSCSIWLRADIETLVQRTSRRKGTRPLLAGGDPRLILNELSAKRSPIYALATVTVDTGEQTAQELAEDIRDLLMSGHTPVGRIPQTD